MRNLFIVIQVLLAFQLFSQEYYTRTGHVHVESYNKIKKIEADNHQVISFLNTETGAINFQGLLRSFEFRLGAIDRVVNSRDLDVSAHPKIEFEGKLLKSNQIDFTKPGKHKVTVRGNLFIWDEKRVTEAEGVIHIKPDGRIEAHSNFVMRIEEQSVEKLNDLMRRKLPDVINVNTNTLGVSRDIIIDLNLEYRLKTW